MMETMKRLELQILLLSLCAMVMEHATSLPTELTKTQQTEEPLIPQVIVDAAANGVMHAAQMTVGDGGGAVDAVDASTLMSLLPMDELPSRGTKCVKIGGYCSLADDCCTKRCLTYAKKCVT